MHNIYVVISKTNSKIGKVIRKFLHSTYGHSAVALDENFNELYSFARKNLYVPLYAGFVKEKPIYYSLGKENVLIPVKIFKIPIADVKFEELKQELNQMYENNDYLYNLFSAILYPIALSFPTYKAYYCSEFTAIVLKKYTGIVSSKKTYKCSPKDIEELLNEYLWYEGNFSDLVEIKKIDDEFFEKMPLKEKIYKTLSTTAQLIKRKHKN